MKRPPTRAKRGEVGLVRIPSGCWGIRWGRALSRRAGLPLVESTQTRDRAEALDLLDRRRIEVFRALGDDERSAAVVRAIAPIAIDKLVSDFLREYRDGSLPGRKPAPGTVGLCISHLLGDRGGFVGFARAQARSLTSQLDVVVVTRWLETESRRLSDQTLRGKLVAARHIYRYGHSRGLIRPEALKAVLAIRAPAAARGRARVDGVPALDEVGRLLRALEPRWTEKRAAIPWQKIAELQLRLGLRRAEVIALDETWLDIAQHRVVVRVTEAFDTKSHASRTIDGVDVATFALAHTVIAVKRKHAVTASGYKEAWKRAVKRLEKAGTPWRYRNKSHSLRSVYATMSRLAGVPLTVVRDRLGHSSEKVTERHYLGRTTDTVPGPFAGRELLTAEPVHAEVIPLPMPQSA